MLYLTLSKVSDSIWKKLELLVISVNGLFLVFFVNFFGGYRLLAGRFERNRFQPAMFLGRQHVHRMNETMFVFYEFEQACYMRRTEAPITLKNIQNI